MTYKSGRHFLQIPGPSNVPDRILHAIGHPTIDHRGPQFKALSEEVLIGSRRIFKTSGPGGDFSDLGNRSLGSIIDEYPQPR